MRTEVERAQERLRSPADARLLRRVYVTFYRCDWRWHAGMGGVLLATLGCYRVVATASGRLIGTAVAGAAIGDLLAGAWWLTAAFLGLAALSLLERGFLEYVMVGRAVVRAQLLILEHVLRCPLDYFETRSPGDLRNVIVDLVPSAATATMGLVQPALTIVRGVFLVVVMATINARLALLATLIIIAYAVFFALYQRPIGVEVRRLAVAERALSAAVDDAYRGFGEIKRNGLEQPVLRSFTAIADRWVAIEERYVARWVALCLSGDFIGTLLPVAMLLAAAVPALAGGVPPEQFVAVYTLAMLLISSFRSLTSANRDVLMGAANWRQVFEVLDAKPEPRGGLPVAGHDIAWQDVKKTLRQRVILDGVTLTIPPGDKVSVIGRSGEGKTTVLRMLPGLLHPDDGTVSLGGVDTRHADPSALRNRVAVVTQTPYLFETSLLHNLTGGKDITAADIDHAIDVVGLRALVDGLPQGLATVVGPDGYALSGGEKARICLARALLSRPDVLILDEAFAHLDSATEERIYTHIAGLPATVITVTHRLSSLVLLPRVIGLANGRIALDGPTTHVVGSPVFRQLFEPQPDVAV